MEAYIIKLISSSKVAASAVMFKFEKTQPLLYRQLFLELKISRI